MSAAIEYCIVVSGERFIFTRDQLESDPGNYFATYFLGGFEEAAKGVQELSIQKEPMLFTLIQAHLRGYDIFPVPDSFIPRYMTKEGAINNLLKEAQFFGLDLLSEKIREYVDKQTVIAISAQDRLKTYKLACHLDGWRLSDIKERVFELYLQHVDTISWLHGKPEMDIMQSLNQTKFDTSLRNVSVEIQCFENDKLAIYDTVSTLKHTDEKQEGMAGSSDLFTTMSSSPLYSIVVSGERFNFTRDQLESDPDNYFATYFFGEFAEAAQGVRELVIEKEPLLFKLIQAHLRGYIILPFSDASIPPYMTKEGALDNLLREAQYYGLDALVLALQEFRAVKPPTLPKYRLKKVTGSKRTIMYDLEEKAFQALLQRVSCPSSFVFVGSNATDQTAPAGYTTVLSWSEFRQAVNNFASYYVDYALLELKEYKHRKDSE